jgi:hypothetical protein
MTWRWVWIRSRLTAIVASGLIWIVLLSLVPEVVAVFVLLSLAVVAGWRTRPVLWLRFGPRRVAAAEAEAVWRSLVPLAWLRGRNQPRLWSSNLVRADVVAADLRQLVLSDALLRRVSHHSVTDLELRPLVVRAIATADVHRSRMVAAVELFCVPWSILATVARAIARPVSSLRLPALAWHARWLFIALAAIDLYRQAHWPGLVMLLLIAIATVTTPRWDRNWINHQVAMADAFEREQAVSERTRTSSATAPGPVRARRSTAPRGGAR